VAIATVSVHAVSGNRTRLGRLNQIRTPAHQL
jgi:hypothetical protein